MKLEAKNISLRHAETGPPLFENISFVWEGPGIRVLMGPSGSGKSTLLKILGAVWHPSSGQIFVNGESLWPEKTSLPNPNLCSRIGFAFQNNALFSSMSVVMNLVFPQRHKFPMRTTRECVEQAQLMLTKVGLEKNQDQLPFELSGGMQKRLAIARALIVEPEFLFLDDPTAGLDPISSRKMARLLEKLLEGQKAMVTLVTNDPDRAVEWGPLISFIHDRKLFKIDDPEGQRLKEIYL